MDYLFNYLDKLLDKIIFFQIIDKDKDKYFQNYLDKIIDNIILSR